MELTVDRKEVLVVSHPTAVHPAASTACNVHSYPCRGTGDAKGSRPVSIFDFGLAPLEPGMETQWKSVSNSTLSLRCLGDRYFVPS